MVKFYHIFIILLFSTLATVHVNGQITIDYGDACGQLDENVVVDVRVNGFTDVRNFNFVTQWDPDVLEYVSYDNVNSALPLGEFGWGTPDLTGKAGRMTVSFSQTGVFVDYTLAPTDVLFSITLKIKSSQVGSTVVDTLDILPENQFFTKQVSTGIKASSNSGRVDLNIPCDGTKINTLSIGDVVGLPGAEVCFPLSGLLLTDLGGFNGLGLNFDPTVLTYTRIINKTSPQGVPFVNANNAANGELNMLYNYVGPGGIGVSADSIALFCVCFNVIGDCDESIDIILSENSAGFGIFNSSGVPLSSAFDDGQFTVNCCDASAVINDVTCPGGNDGSITLTPEGCANITSYTWSGTNQTGASINNLSGGSYDVTITYDNGSSSRVITGYVVDEPDAFDLVNISFTKVTNGGDGGINLSVEGGTSPYSYLWSNGATTEDLNNVNAGDYSLTVTDNRNCTAFFGPYSVASAPRVSGNVSNVECFNTLTGSVTLSVDGGATPYTYNWSCPGTVDPTTGSISGLSGGNCTVTVTDANNCASTMTFAIDAPDSELTANAAITDDVSNDGSGAINLTVTGGWGDYQFEWSDGSSTMYPNSNSLTNLFGGNYSVTVTDAGNCSKVFGPFTVQGLRVLDTDITAVQCFGDNNGAINISVVGGSGTYAYDWSCIGTVDGNGNISGITSGPCTVTVTDVTQNSITSATFVVPGPTQALVVELTATECTNGADGELQANASGGVAPYNYEWNTTPAQSNTTATNLIEGNYTVIVTDSVGCPVMGFGTVISCSEPNCYMAMEVITPNEDGKNDFFIIDCVGNTRTTLRIFTRWGQEVITYDNYQNNWDGRDEGGNLVDEDTYLWVLEVFPVNGNTELYKGAVSVLYSLR